MLLKLNLDNIAPAVLDSDFDFLNGFVKLVSEPLHSVKRAVSGVAGVLPSGCELNQYFVAVGHDDRRTVKCEHSVFLRPTFSVERLRTIRRPSSSIKKFVPFLFTPFAVAKTRANSPMERFISERLRISGTAITATESAVESQKKDSTKTGIDKLSVKIKSRFLSTKASTSKTDSGFGVS